VKVCCITNPAALRLAVRHGADAVGLVGPMPSGTGIVALETARALVAKAPPMVATFLLSSAVSGEQLVAEARQVGCSTLQIVDTVPHSAYAALRAALPALKIVQVIHVTGEETLAEALAVAPLVDALLLDSGVRTTPVPQLGGTGRTHDWEVSRRIVAAVAPMPVLLAGGLTPANAAQAIRTVRPFGVDLCTGLRTAGELDEAKLTAFMQAVATA
jgi:phosphoribosylanthranilate isomerase